jgi:hypothetical protein
MQDKQRFLRNLCQLADVMREPELSEARQMAYVQVFSKYDDEQLEQAMFKAMTTLKWFPKPAELIELLEGKREDAALVAWEKLQEAVRRAGRFQSVMFDDPKIARVVDAIGGWSHVCDWSLREMSIHRAQFLKAYQALDTPAENRPLIGQHDAQNSATGYLEHVRAPMQIGAKPKRLELN